MSPRAHLRVFLIASGIWAGFWVGGLPDYYRQYSFETMLAFTLLAIPIVASVAWLVLRRLRPERRINTALWLAFYFTAPFALYDWLYCGLYLGNGIAFVVPYWYLSVYYLLPWLIFPPIGAVLKRRGS